MLSLPIDEHDAMLARQALAQLAGGYDAAHASSENVHGERRPLTDLIVSPQDVTEAEHALAQAIEQGSFRVETVRRCKSGALVNVDMSMRCVRDSEGRVAFIALRMNGVGENRRSADREDRFPGLLEAAPDAMVVVGKDGGIVLVNGQTERLFGYAREELLGQLVEILVPDRFRENHPAHRGGYFGTPRVRPMAANLELTARRKDGTEFPAEISLSPIEVPEGTFTTAAIRDITTRKQAADALRRSEENLAITLNSIGDAVISTDADGRVVHANPVAQRLTGWSLADAKGRPRQDVFHIVNEETRAPLESPAERVLREGITVELANHTALMRRDGTAIPIADSAAPILDACGKAVGVVLVFRDCTRERDIEEERKILQERLLTADRMSSIGTLAAGVAHEINNPLTYILANMDFAAEELRQFAGASPSGRLNELIAVVGEAREGAERVRKIVRGLKTFSRSEGEQRLPQEIHRVLEVSINMTYNEIRHRARLVKDFGTVPMVEADESRLAQVFINLLVNAAQSIPAGRAELNEIRVTTRGDDHGHAVIEFRDTGCGVPPEIRKRLFDPFFTTKPIGVGTGLGLSICHGIVTALAGEIQVESEVGKGSTFRVILPSARTDVPADAARSSVRPRVGRGGRVLIVDDEPMVVLSVTRILSQEHEITARGSAQEALALLAAGQQFDVILCDLMMPDMCGMELHAEVERLAPSAAERMIFMTGGAFAPAARAFLDRVPNHRIEKPFDVQALRAVIRAFVAQSSSRPP